MTLDLWKSFEKGLKGFFTAGGASMVLSLLSQYPPQTVILGSLTVGILVGVVQGLWNAYNHWGDSPSSTTQSPPAPAA